MRAHWKGKNILYMLEKEPWRNDVFKMSKINFICDYLEFLVQSLGLFRFFIYKVNGARVGVRVILLGLQEWSPTIIKCVIIHVIILLNV